MVNKVIVMGRLGDDPELTSVGDSIVCKVSVAVSESYKKNDGEKIESTEWFNCEAWGGLAEIISQYMSKGDMVYFEGKQKTDKWENEEGEKRQSVKMRITSFSFVPNGNSGSEGKKERNKSRSKKPDPLGDQEEGGGLPF